MNSSSRNRLAVLLSVLASSLSSACSLRNSKLNRIVEDHFEEYLKLDPLFATSIGDERYNDQLAIPITKEHRAKELALIEGSLAKVQRIGGCASFKDQAKITCEIFVDELETSRELERVSLDHLLLVDQFDSFFSEFAELAAGSSYVEFETEKDYRDFLARMNRIPDYFDATIANLREGMKLGVTTPRGLVEKAHTQMVKLLAKNPLESVFAKPLKNLKDVDGKNASLKSDYEKAIADKIYPAYRKLETFIKNEYLPKARLSHGIASVPGGQAYYEALIRSHTTTRMRPDEIHELGLKEVARIRADFEKVKETLGHKGDLQSFFAALRKDPKLFPFHSEEEVLNAYRGIQSRVMAKVPEFFSRTPKAAFEVREVEKFRAENASEAYQNPTPDGSRPGIFWVPIPNPTHYSAKNMESLFLHEAIPGHHFQISLQQELKLPRFRRFGGNNAYVEGWALYTESLGKELGVYTDPYQWVGRLENEMHRAIRLVVDTGMHVKGWTREKAIQYSLDNEPADEDGVTSEIERYMVIPAQALSYKLGEIKIRELRERASQQQGKKFDIRLFHEKILEDGALPLSVLDAKISAWLAER